MLLTINQIIERFRTHGACVKFSPQTIIYMADRLGYTKKRVGGKIGYDQSLITAITRHFNEAVEYDNECNKKMAQKPPKQPQMKPRELDYVGYNGERDNIDYEWEKEDNDKIKSESMVLYCDGKGKTIHINESSLSLLIDEGFQRTAFYVKGMLRTPMDLTSVETTEHWDERSVRVGAFAEKVRNAGDAEYSFIVDTKHPNGDEIHTITERAFIIIQNKDTRKIITVLAARPAQITRYWRGLKRPLPNDPSFELIMRFAKNNEDRGLNNM